MGFLLSAVPCTHYTHSILAALPVWLAILRPWSNPILQPMLVYREIQEALQRSWRTSGHHFTPAATPLAARRVGCSISVLSFYAWSGIDLPVLPPAHFARAHTSRVSARFSFPVCPCPPPPLPSAYFKVISAFLVWPSVSLLFGRHRPHLRARDRYHVRINARHGNVLFALPCL